jgi:hypothetical protein
MKRKIKKTIAYLITFSSLLIACNPLEDIQIQENNTLNIKYDSVLIVDNVTDTTNVIINSDALIEGTLDIIHEDSYFSIIDIDLKIVNIKPNSIKMKFAYDESIHDVAIVGINQIILDIYLIHNGKLYKAKIQNGQFLPNDNNSYELYLPRLIFS